MKSQPWTTSLQRRLFCIYVFNFYANLDEQNCTSFYMNINLFVFYYTTFYITFVPTVSIMKILIFIVWNIFWNVDKFLINFLMDTYYIIYFVEMWVCIKKKYITLLDIFPLQEKSRNYKYVFVNK